MKNEEGLFSSLKGSSSMLQLESKTPQHIGESSQHDRLMPNLALAEKRLQILENEELKYRKIGQENALLVGTCQDMCPEIERYFREAKQRFSFFECDQNYYESSNTLIFDHNRAVKDYSRSSADQAIPLPSDLRPTETLLKTLRYLMAAIVDTPEMKSYKNIWKHWYEFLWTRTRAIRKDIIQQRLCNEKTAFILETIVRFHIFSAARLVDQPPDVFDARINSENLSKCLQSLKEVYSDLYLSSNTCLDSESEFRSYMILMKLNDDNVVDEIQKLRPEIRQSDPVKLAVGAYHAITENNYVRFFKLVESASCLTACLMHRYFNQIRHKAIEYPIEKIIKILGFEEETHVRDFFATYQIEIDSQFVYLEKIGLNSSINPPEIRPKKLIESKRNGKSMSELFFNGPIDQSWSILSAPMSSFSSHEDTVQSRHLVEKRVQSLLSLNAPGKAGENFLTSKPILSEQTVNSFKETPQIPDHEINSVIDRLVDEICQEIAVKNLALELILNEYVWTLTKEIMFEECDHFFSDSKKKIQILEEEKAFSLELLCNAIIREFTEETLHLLLPPIIAREGIIMEDLLPEFLHYEIEASSRESILELAADVFYYKNLISKSLNHWLKQTRYSKISRKRSAQHLEILPLPLSSFFPSVESFNSKRNRVYLEDVDDEPSLNKIHLHLVYDKKTSSCILDWLSEEVKRYKLNYLSIIDNDDLQVMKFIVDRLDSLIYSSEKNSHILIFLMEKFNDNQDLFSMLVPKNINGIIGVSHAANMKVMNQVKVLSQGFTSILMAGKPSILWSKNLGMTIKKISKNTTLNERIARFTIQSGDQGNSSNNQELNREANVALFKAVHKKYLEPFEDYILYADMNSLTTHHKPTGYLACYNKFIERLHYLPKEILGYLSFKIDSLEPMQESDDSNQILKLWDMFSADNTSQKSELCSMKQNVFLKCKIDLVSTMKAMEIKYLIPTSACLVPWSKVVFCLIKEIIGILEHGHLDLKSLLTMDLNALFSNIPTSNIFFDNGVTNWSVKSIDDRVKRDLRTFNNQLIQKDNEDENLLPTTVHFPQSKLSSQINKVKSIFDRLGESIKLSIGK